jgi:stage V sporulation protein G
MEITEIRVRKVNQDDPENKLRAFATVTFNNAFAVHDIKIIKSTQGLIVAMPSRKTPDETYKDICHPINQATRNWLQDAILEKYEAALLEGEE